MKILLCTPYNVNPKVVQSGIAIWAQNIISYYKTLNSDVEIGVVAYDRTTYAKENCSLLKRARLAYVDYRRPINETNKQLASGQYDLMHLCTSASISLLKDILLLCMAKRNGVRTVVHFHFGRIPELALQCNWEWKLLLKVLNLADAIITMDTKSFTTLKEHCANRLYYLPNPLSQSIMQQIEQEATSVERIQRKLSFVGHVFLTKGVCELVEACKQIDNIKLHVFGMATPEIREKMLQLAGYGDWLVFEGEVSHRQVIRELLSTDIFILPTYTEGFPNVILESMACGCAIATTPVGAIPEMLDLDSDEPCGLCCEPKDVKGLYDNIKYYLDNPMEARQFARRSIKRVNEMYAVQKVWEKLVEIWNS